MKSTFFAVAMTAMNAQATMLKSNSAVATQTASEYVDVWAWLDDHFVSRTVAEANDIVRDDHMYSRTSEAIRTAMYFSLAEDISRYIAEETPADLMAAHAGDDDVSHITDEWRENARENILHMFNGGFTEYGPFPLKDLYEEIEELQHEAVVRFLCKRWGPCDHLP